MIHSPSPKDTFSHAPRDRLELGPRQIGEEREPPEVLGELDVDRLSRAVA